MEKGKLGVLFISTILLFGATQINSALIFAAGEAVTIPLEQETMSFYSPYQVLLANIYKDGGSIGVKVRDARGVLLLLCYDGRIGVAEENRFVYAGATYPTEANAEKVAVGSDAASSIIKILKTANIDKNNQNAREDLVQFVIKKLEGATPSGQFSQIAGKWNTSFGKMVITQDDSRISGSYTHDSGKIDGKLEGDVLKGWWSESPTYKPDQDAGDLEFTFSQDWKSFTGKWRYGSGSTSWSGTWSGQKE